MFGKKKKLEAERREEGTVRRQETGEEGCYQ